MAAFASITGRASLRALSTVSPAVVDVDPAGLPPPPASPPMGLSANERAGQAVALGNPALGRGDGKDGRRASISRRNIMKIFALTSAVAAAVSPLATPLAAFAKPMHGTVPEGLCIMSIAGRQLVVDTADFADSVPTPGAEYVVLDWYGRLLVTPLEPEERLPHNKQLRTGMMRTSEFSTDQVKVLGRVVAESRLSGIAVAPHAGADADLIGAAARMATLWIELEEVEERAAELCDQAFDAAGYNPDSGTREERVAGCDRWLGLRKANGAEALLLRGEELCIEISQLSSHLESRPAVTVAGLNAKLAALRWQIEHRLEPMKPNDDTADLEHFNRFCAEAARLASTA